MSYIGNVCRFVIKDLGMEAVKGAVIGAIGGAITHLFITATIDLYPDFYRGLNTYALRDAPHQFEVSIISSAALFSFVLVSNKCMNKVGEAIKSSNCCRCFHAKKTS